MKKPCMGISMVSSVRDCFNDLISTLRLEAGLFEGSLFLVGQYDPPTYVLEEEIIQYSNLF